MPRSPATPFPLTPLARIVLASLVFTLVAASAGPVANAQQTTVPRDDPRFGAVQSIHSPDRAVSAGMKWERIIFPWSEMQPGSPEQMFQGYFSDSQIDGQIRRGMTLVGVVLYTPSWAATDPTKGASAVPRGLDRPHTDPANYWARFVHRLANNYRGKIDTWIVWNEPDIVDLESKQPLNWAGSEAEFWQLQKSAYLAIKQANPNATVLLPGFAYWHAKQAGLEPFLKRLLDVGARDSSAQRNNWYFDGVALHPYANPLNSFTLPTLFRRILAEKGLKKPIWNVESNAVPWDDPVGLLPREPWRVTMDEQASYIVQMLALSLAADVERVSVYKMRDEFAENGQYFGLVREDGSTRPAYTALQTAVTYFSGARKATYTWNGSGNPPSEAELTNLLNSHLSRVQFVWPGQVNQVAIERERERVTVLWNVTPRPLVGVVRAAANGATLVDSHGRKTEIAPRDGSYRVYLDAARSNTDHRDHSLLLVGGRPAIIVEQLPANPPASQPPAVAGGLSFENGFVVANGPFAEYFQQRGGVRTFGLPISREFDLLGAPTQIFQRQVLQLAPDGSVRTLNLLDDLMPYTSFNGSTLPGTDPGLKSQAPSPADPAYADRIVSFLREQAPDAWQGRNVRFGQTVFGTVTCADAFADTPCQEGLLPLLNFEFWGAPLSRPTADPGNASFVYQRFQKGILHYDAACDCTQGLLLGELFKSIITGHNLPPDLEQQAAESPYLKQYDQSRVQGLTRPGALPRSNFKDAFEPLPR
jgi:hypothetical protein